MYESTGDPYWDFAAWSAMLRITIFLLVVIAFGTLVYFLWRFHRD